MATDGHEAPPRPATESPQPRAKNTKNRF